MQKLHRSWRTLLGALVATGTLAGVAAVVSAPAAHAAFPGTNGPVVFQGENGPEDIDLLNPVTGIVTTICPAAQCPTPHPFRPTTNAAGTTVVFGGTSGISTVPITGGGVTVVTSTLGDSPSFTPDGSTIVFDTPGGTLSKVPSGGGSPSTIFGAPPGCVEKPEVSPTGTAVAYIDTCATGDNLETVPVAGGSPSVVVSDTAGSDQVSWSPDGTKIALVDSNHCASHQIGVVSASASNAAPTCLPSSTSTDVDPSFSPDGTQIVVESDTGAGGAALLATNGSPGRTTFSVSALGANYWAPQPSSATTTTTTPGATTTTTTCTGTLTGTAYKGSKVKKHGLSGATLTATPAAGTALTATSGAGGTYTLTVPCGTYTKTAGGPAKSSRVCHFGSGTGPTSATATVTSGSTDTENLFCLKA